MLKTITTEINGQPYSGWKNFRKTTALQKIHADVSFTAVEDPLIKDSLWLPQNDLTIRYGNEVVFIGRIDQYDETIESSSEGEVNHTTSVRGRSLCAVMADSNFPLITQLEISGGQTTLYAFLDKLTKPFGLGRLFEIRGPRNPSPVKHARLNEYNKVDKELLYGLSTMRSATATSTATGGFKVITESDYQQVGSITNFKKLNLTVNETSRFHTYEITNQTTNGTLSAGSSSGSQTLATSTDESVIQDDRLLRLRSIGNESNSQEYAHWVNNTSFAKSRRINVTIVGCDNADGVMYEPGQLVTMGGEIFDRSKASSIKEWLIDRVTNTQSYPGSGTITELSMIHPDAYLSAPREEAQTSGTLISTLPS